jgi:DNA-binding NtrC family response regulator
MRREMSTLKKQMEAAKVSSPTQAEFPSTQLTPIHQSAFNSLHNTPLSERELPALNSAEDAEAEEYVEPELESLNLNDIGRQLLEKALERNGGNRKKAAQELGISDRTLYRRLKQYGLE